MDSASHLGGDLPLPPFFDHANAARWEYRADQQVLFEVASAWRATYGIPHATRDRAAVHLLLVDLQKDFCFPEGSLYVGGRSGRGAVEDNARIAAFVYRNLARLTRITTTLDTHFAFQIFFPSFWIDAAGAPLHPHTVIHAADIAAGAVRPNPAVTLWVCDEDYAWLERQASYYCAELERAGKYELYLWPPHCLLGSDGHTLAGVVHEARLFHAFARATQSWSELKGMQPLTENYSVLRPEVLLRFDGRPLAQKNTPFLETLLAADVLIVAGQASSHCVRSSVDDLLEAIQSRDPGLARKVYILQDCMSAVTVPDGHGGFLADFTSQAEAAYMRWDAAGMHLVHSTQPMRAWPDIHLDN
jgi:nicotinamidase-related amidase